MLFLFDGSNQYISLNLQLLSSFQINESAKCKKEKKKITLLLWRVSFPNQ